MAHGTSWRILLYLEAAIQLQSLPLESLAHGPRSTTSHGVASCYVFIGHNEDEDVNRSPSNICHRSLDMLVGHKYALFPIAILS